MSDAAPNTKTDAKTELNQYLTQDWAESPSIGRTLANALVITRREVRDSFRDWRIVIPIFLLTLVFPLLANLASGLFTNLLERSSDFEDTQVVLDTFLPLLPMLVGFFPVSISLVIALETFVGEKERLSLEPLLSTPLTNTELYLGKMFAAIIPPLVAGYFGMAVYIGNQVFLAGWRPDAILIVQIILLTAIQAAVMVTGAVVISSQTTSTRAANLLASAIIIPMSLLVIVEALIMIQPEERFVLWWIMLGLVGVVIILIRTGARIFNREELLGRSIDNIDLRWAVRVFAEQWRGGVKTFAPLQWYRQSVFTAVWGLRKAMLAYCVGAMMLFALGWYYADRYALPLDDENVTEEIAVENLRDIVELGQGEPSLVVLAFAQNVRVTFFAFGLGAISFGVMGLFLTALPFGMWGYAIANVVRTDVVVFPFLMAMLPHGIIEMPAIVIAGAAAMKLGAIVSAPPKNMTVGEAWVRQFADSLKIGIFVVLPMLAIAAILEVHITPEVVAWALS